MTKEIIEKLIELTEKSMKNNEFPVAAIIYDENGIISYGYNRRNASKKTIDHAEIIAITRANKKLKEWRLQNKCMIVSLEPCDMCKSVIKEARLKKVYYLISRQEAKKQYKRTIFEKLNSDENLIENYVEKLNNFFKSKR